jgi:hypothetical protein
LAPLSTTNRLRNVLQRPLRGLLPALLAACVSLPASHGALAQEDDSDQTAPPPSGVRHVVRHHVDAPEDSAKPEAPPAAEPAKPSPAKPAKAAAHPKVKAPAKKPTKHKKAKPTSKHREDGSPV